MKFEVEQKHPVAGFSANEARLATMHAKIGPASEELDLYFAHPVRNFAETDEALRIRRTGDKTQITYKGPKIDQTTKTRHEIELPLGDQPGTPELWRQLLEVLGFQAVAEVRKMRRRVDLVWRGEAILLTLDDVDRVGTFVELEIVSDPDQVDHARQCLAGLAGQLGLSDSERRSYLELLLER
ncbi:MAG: class IV adenylate cyclase [Thermoguttaceae bacterium]